MFHRLSSPLSGVDSCCDTVTDNLSHYLCCSSAHHSTQTHSAAAGYSHCCHLTFFISLHDNFLTRVMFMFFPSPLSLLFTNNFARESGGGVYVEFPPIKFTIDIFNHLCFLQYRDPLGRDIPSQDLEVRG